MVKNCDRGLENAARGRSIFLSQFFTMRTDLKPANNLFIFSCEKLASDGFTQLCYWINRAYVLSTNIVKRASERVTQTLDKERCIKEYILYC